MVLVVVVGLVVILRKKRRWKFKQNEKFNKRETKEKSSNNIFLKDQRKCLCICFVNEKLSKRKLPNKDVVNYKGKALQTHFMFPFFFLKSSIPSYVCMVGKIWEKFLLSECNIIYTGQNTMLFECQYRWQREKEGLDTAIFRI